jgi:murein DD-endopeptidase MepM/ murein hydrolase activator NlpD
VYDSNGRPIWASDTDGGRQGSTIGQGRLIASPPSQNQGSGWQLPWGSASYRINGSWHKDDYELEALDFKISAGTPIYAPTDSTVVHTCNAGKNHRAIKLRASDGQFYSLIHVRASDDQVYRRKSFRQGDLIGTVAPEKNDDGLNTRCARTTGVHLHMGFPKRPFTMGGKTFE